MVKEVAADAKKTSESVRSMGQKKFYAEKHKHEQKKD
jgi:hypothetical protein